MDKKNNNNNYESILVNFFLTYNVTKPIKFIATV